jgi:hypothetical protein
MICVKLPEPAIKHIEVLIGEILANFVDIFFSCYIEEHILKIGTLEVTETYLPIIIDVNLVEDSHNHSISIAILEFWCRLKELQARMSFKEYLHHRFEVFRNNGITLWFGQDFEDAFFDIKGLKLSPPVELKSWLGNLSSFSSVNPIKKEVFQELG